MTLTTPHITCECLRTCLHTSLNQLRHHYQNNSNQYHTIHHEFPPLSQSLASRRSGANFTFLDPITKTDLTKHATTLKIPLLRKRFLTANKKDRTYNNTIDTPSTFLGFILAFGISSARRMDGSEQHRGGR